MNKLFLKPERRFEIVKERAELMDGTFVRQLVARSLMGQNPLKAQNLTEPFSNMKTFASLPPLLM